ncbi:MAG: hypothetical protein ACFC1C_03075 [Candidatus Malihini olakiniferum]
MANLQQGQSIGLVSDAGTLLINDHGHHLRTALSAAWILGIGFLRRLSASKTKARQDYYCNSLKRDACLFSTNALPDYLIA